jgi:hypothetical protein
MKKIYIDKIFYYNRINYQVEIKHNANLTFTLAKRSTFFASLKEKIDAEDIVENCLKTKYKGILFSYDADLECVIIDNLTYEDFYFDLFNECVFLTKENTAILENDESENPHHSKQKKQKSKASEKN